MFFGGLFFGGGFFSGAPPVDAGGGGPGDDRRARKIAERSAHRRYRRSPDPRWLAVFAARELPDEIAEAAAVLASEPDGSKAKRAADIAALHDDSVASHRALSAAVRTLAAEVRRRVISADIRRASEAMQAFIADEREALDLLLAMDASDRRMIAAAYGL